MHCVAERRLLAEHYYCESLALGMLASCGDVHVRTY